MGSAMGRNKNTYTSLSDQLRVIIRNHEMSRYAICRAADVDPSQLHRFLNGKGRLTTDSLDRIGKALGLRLAPASSDSPQGK